MPQNKRMLAVLPALCVVTVMSIVLGTMFLCTYDTPSSLATNSFGNIMNGGYVASDGSMMYFVDSQGELKSSSKLSYYKLADGPCDSLYPHANGIIYRDNGAVKFSTLNGSEEHLLAQRAAQIMVSGNWLYFTDDDADMHKCQIGRSKVYDLGFKVSGQFVVVGNYIHYIGQDGYLYTASTDGSSSQRFLAEPIERFMVYGNFLYYLSDGRVCSVASANTASRKDYVDADEFNIMDDTLIYVKDDKMFTLDLTDPKAKPRSVTLQGESARGLCVLDSKLYYFDSDKRLVRMSKDGSDWQIM